jgi:hypothetical protein
METYLRNNSAYKYYENSGLFHDIIVVFGLNYSYFSMTSLIQKNHPGRYSQIKASLKYFYLVETIPLVVTLTLDIIQISIMIFIKVDVSLFTNLIEFIWILYPLLQTFGMLYLKDTKDPLSGISKLD